MQVIGVASSSRTSRRIPRRRAVAPSWRWLVRAMRRQLILRRNISALITERRAEACRRAARRRSAWTPEQREDAERIARAWRRSA